MRFAAFIEDSLVNMVRTYREYFRKTLGAAMIFSLVSIIGACLFLMQAPDPAFEYIHRYYFLSLITHHISNMGNGYHFIDLFKQLFLILSALFGIGLIWVMNTPKYSFMSIVSGIRLNDLGNLLVAAAAIVATDVLIHYFQFSVLATNGFGGYIFYLLEYVRAYSPFVYLSIAVSKSLYDADVKVSARPLAFVLAIAFIANGILYELVTSFDGIIVFPLHLLIQENDTKFLIEVLVAVPILSCFLLGYATIFYFPLRNYTLKTQDVSNEVEEDETDDADDLSLDEYAETGEGM